MEFMGTRLAEGGTNTHQLGCGGEETAELCGPAVDPGHCDGLR